MLHLKSIDVGSMFLMDLSVHESDLNETNAFNSTTLDKDSVFLKTNLSSSQNNIIDTKNSPTIYDHLNSTSGYSLNDISKNDHKKQTTQPSSCERIAYHRSTQGNYNLGNSLDRLASAINGSLNDGESIDQNQFRNNIDDEIDIGKEGKISQVTIVEPQPPPEIENQFSSASSLSDESYVASSGSATSYTASVESVETNDDDDDDDDNHHYGSSTTREDSGVLDIKDLGNHQLSNSYDNEDICQQQQRFDHNQEKAISNNVMATNLINKSANNTDQNSSALMQQNFSSSINTNNNMNNKPTNNHFNHQNHHHNHSHRNTSFSQPQRSMSASLPIEVPPRQMKRELKKSKRDYKNQTDNEAREVKNCEAEAAAVAATNSKRNIDDVLDDDFLDQEYNENHHNHYPIDEFDEEPLRAEENPMKLFESIQALARSLHEDAELFGSLPPKRMLESPIRSLIFS